MRAAAGILVLALAPLSLVVFPAAEARADENDLVLDLGGEKLETRRVTHGSFVQGSQATETVHDRDEEPAHQVTITKDFWIGKYPVTRGEFAKFVADTRFVTDAEKAGAGGSGWDGHQLTQRKDFTWRSPGFTQMDEHPVVLVSFGDATAFVGWASRKTGKRVRLPTEAEWEYAARGGTTTTWYGAGSDAEALTLGWFKANAGNGTRPVGQKKANSLGVFDMAGDVYEWCRDVYAPYKDVALIDPEVAAGNGTEPEKRVLRGGSWLRDPKRGRSAARYRNAPTSRTADNGFRIVVTNEEVVAPAATGAGVDFAPASPLGLSTGAPAGSAPPAATGPLGPLADGEAARLDAIAHNSDATFSWGLLLASPLASASAVVAWMLLRKRRPRRPALASSSSSSSVRASSTASSSSSASTSPSTSAPASSQQQPGITKRAVTDGFYVSVSNATPGSKLKYSCMVNGAVVIDTIPLDGAEETFVYTGSEPSAIRIVEILVAVRGPSLAAQRARPPVMAPRPPPPPRSTPSVIIEIDPGEDDGDDSEAEIDDSENIVTQEAPPVAPKQPSKAPPLPAAATAAIAAASPPPAPVSSSKAPPPVPSSSSKVPPAPPSSSPAPSSKRPPPVSTSSLPIKKTATLLLGTIAAEIAAVDHDDDDDDAASEAATAPLVMPSSKSPPPMDAKTAFAVHTESSESLESEAKKAEAIVASAEHASPEVFEGNPRAY